MQPILIPGFRRTVFSSIRESTVWRRAFGAAGLETRWWEKEREREKTSFIRTIYQRTRRLALNDNLRCCGSYRRESLCTTPFFCWNFEVKWTIWRDVTSSEDTVIPNGFRIFWNYQFILCEINNPQNHKIPKLLQMVHHTPECPNRREGVLQQSCVWLLSRAGQASKRTKQRATSMN